MSAKVQESGVACAAPGHEPGASCGLKAIVLNPQPLCVTHYKQHLRDRPLTPIRPRGSPLIHLTTHVQPFVRDELAREGVMPSVQARAVLTEWAEARRGERGHAPRGRGRKKP